MDNNNSPSRSSDSLRTRRPFMQLDLQNVPKSYNKVTFHQQCYKLVADLSPEESVSIGNKTHQEESKWQANNGQRRRRLLPEIPAGSKPLEKLWQRQMDQSKMADPLSVEIANSITADPAPIGQKGASSNQRWTRKLSTNMLLEIETDCLSEKALSLRLINDEQDAKEQSSTDQTSESHSLASGGLFSPQTDQDSLYSFSTPKPSRERTKTNTSDSGVSSNLQSPTVSTNSDMNEQSTSHDDSSTSRDNSLTLPEPTHRALYKFCARHSDELNFEIGDGVYVYQEYDDHWSSGLNTRSGCRGIFPTSLVTDVEYSEFTIDGATLQAQLFEEERRLPSVNFRIKRERFLLDFLGSIEVSESKGEEVLREAISRVSIGARPSDIGIDTPCPCILEVSDIGIRMLDDTRQSKSTKTQGKLSRLDYFFSLLQITYCGYRPRHEHYFFAFITRHPSDRARFACHVFRTGDNTREVAEAVGRAFHRFYNRFIEMTLPLETFYLDN